MHAPNHASAFPGTWETFLTIDQMVSLKRSLRAIGSKKIFDAGTSTLNSLLQDSLQFVMQAARCRGGQLTCKDVRMQAGSKQSFICINIADTRDHLLVQQYGFQTPAALLQ